MSSLAALVGFLLLSAPGLVYEAFREKCRPTIEHTPLREAGRVTLASVVFTGAAVAVLGVVRIIFPSTLPSPASWATSQKYRTAHWLLAARAVSVGVVLACCLAALAAWTIHHKQARMRPDPVLWLATHAVQPKPSAVSAQVRLANGAVYMGVVRAIDYSGDPGTRMIALEAPLFRSDHAFGELPLSELHRLVLPLSEAEAIGFTFQAPPGTAAPTHWCLRLRHA